MPEGRPLGRAARLEAILERDGSACVWCGSPIGTRLTRATTEHLVPKLKGGPSWMENELAACPRCNSRRGHAAPVTWLGRCHENGWHPRADLVRDRLTELVAAIEAAGGQRRALAYARKQLARLNKLRGS